MPGGRADQHHRRVDVASVNSARGTGRRHQRLPTLCAVLSSCVHVHRPWPPHIVSGWLPLIAFISCRHHESVSGLVLGTGGVSAGGSMVTPELHNGVGLSDVGGWLGGWLAGWLAGWVGGG